MHAIPIVELHCSLKLGPLLQTKNNKYLGVHRISKHHTFSKEKPTSLQLQEMYWVIYISRWNVY